MKKATYSSIVFIFLVQLAAGQVTQKMKELFHGMPVDSSRKVICQWLKADNRFREKLSDPVKETYVGLCSERGLIKSKPDSVLMRLTYGNAMLHENDSLIKTTIIASNYYFSSLEEAQAEYDKMTSLVKPLAKDSASDSMGDEEAAGEGMYYNFSEKKSVINEIDLYVVTCAAGNYGLFISYTRSE